MNRRLTNTLCLAIANLLVFLLVFLSREHGFFWDTVQLASQHGNFYYTHNFSKLLLPTELDSGHIPGFGMYIALMWTIFGKTLAVSHLSMLPFAIGIVWQLYYLCRRFIPEQFVGIALLLVLIDATLMSQITLVSPDVLLVFFFLLALNAVLNNRKIWIFLSVVFLFLISMRGMMLSVCLVLLDVYVNYGFRKTLSRAYLLSLMKRALIYLPALLLFVAFNVYHFKEKGWIGYHKDSPWADCFEPVEFKGFLRNIGFLGWRLLDFGRIGVWSVLIWLVFKYKKLALQNKHIQPLWFLVVVILILLPLNMLWAKNLMGHRYLMPIYLSVSFLTAGILFSDFVQNRLRHSLILIWSIVSLTGNIWIYPPKISKGWDATLAHLPYYSLRKETLAYLDKQQINFKETDSFFPNCYAIEEIDFKDDQRNFDYYTIGNSSKYIFYSNIFNVDDDTYDYMLKHYKPLQTFKSNGVYVILFQKVRP